MKKLVIEPFNDVWYDNCFIHAILPIIRYNGVNLEEFLHGEEILYYYFDNSIRIGLEKVQNLDYYLGMIDYKINYLDEQEPIKVIENYIDKSIPVIIWVDCFYVNRRRDTFGKKHLAHCLLVYGYDADKRQLIVYDHEHENGLQFEEKRIGYVESNYCMEMYKKIYRRQFCMATISKENIVNNEKEFKYISNNRGFFWESVENDIKTLKLENFERQIEFFGKYERLLRALGYANKVDYSNEIKNASLIKMFFGKALYYSKMPEETQDKVLRLYEQIQIK